MQESFFADLTLVSADDDNVQLEPDEAEIQINPVGGRFLPVDHNQSLSLPL